MDNRIQMDRFEDVLDRIEENEESQPEISTDAHRVLTAVRVDWAYGRDTYDPEVAAQNTHEFTAEELEELCEKLVEEEKLERSGDVYKLPDTDE